jgi:hypothetical protein
VFTHSVQLEHGVHGIVCGRGYAERAPEQPPGLALQTLSDAQHVVLHHELLGDLDGVGRGADADPCRLCDLTYDRFTMKSEWKQFLASLPIDCAFALRDQFHRKYPAYADLPLPAVFRHGNSATLTTLLSADQINSATTIEALRRLVSAALHD